MKLDNINEPRTFWYEDQDGNDVPFEWGDVPKVEGGCYQHSVNMEVSHSICTQFEDPAWPIRFLKWLIKKMPNSWKGSPSQLCRGTSTINGCYPIVKYLVEKRDFSFNDAAVVASQLCERCMNICLWELEGHDLTLEESYLSNTTTFCDYCKDIDAAYEQQHKLWCCYRTYKFGGDVAKAYRDISVNSNKEYMKKHGITYYGKVQPVTR